MAENHTTALIIDEGQKMAPSCLEILREFLNYETNTHKLLQIVIFAQKEFDQIIADTPNFADRINLRLEMNPLGFGETMALIHFRIQVAGGGPAGRPARVAGSGLSGRVRRLASGARTNGARELAGLPDRFWKEIRDDSVDEVAEQPE